MKLHKGRAVAQKAAALTHKHRFHLAHTLAHIAYFCGVAIEGHGLYAIAGATLTVFTVFQLVSELTDNA